MDRTELSMESDGSFTVSGPLPADPRQGNQNLTEWLKKLILRLNEVKKMHAELKADDGRLIGQERYELIAGLDHTLAHLIVIRAIIERDNDFSAFVLKQHHKLNIRVRKDRWAGRGMLGIYRKLNDRHFQVWLSRVMKERLVKIIQFYGQSMSDGVLDSRERIILNRSLDRLIFGVILVREHVKAGMIE